MNTINTTKRLLYDICNKLWVVVKQYEKYNVLIS